MQPNEYKINIRPREKSENIEIFQSQFCDQPLPSKYTKKPFKRSSQIFNTKNVSRQKSLETQQKQTPVRSGFNIHRKYMLKGQNESTPKDDPSMNKSIFSRRVNSETKASKTKIQLQSSQMQGNKSQGKINFAKKLIEDMKRQTFQMRKSSSRYSGNKQTSKSVELRENKAMSRQKLIQNSMQKLRPSFNINEVKFFSSKKSMGKSINEAKGDNSSNLFKPGKQKSVNLEDKISKQISKSNRSEETLDKILKNIASPLASYTEYIKSPNGINYEIKMNFLNQYIKLAVNESVLAHVDFSSMKLLQSIYLCLIDIFSAILPETKANVSKTFNYDIVKEYVGVYFQTYSKIKTEFILCEILFRNVKRKLSQYFLMQRVIFYWMVQLCSEQKILDRILDIKRIVTFLKLSEEILASILSMLVEDSVSKKATQDSFIDTFKSLRLTRELDKRLPILRESLQSINLHKKIKSDEEFVDLSESFLQLLASTDKQQNFDVLTIFKLEQYFNWTTLKIPPLFYLPINPSKPYTLVIDLDGTLIFYNQETRILKYRPYMDRFLQAMQKNFELIVFSSHPKQRSDIIINQIQRGQSVFAYRLYKSHMVFQEGVLRKNVGYLGRNLQKVVFIDDEDKNVQWLASNSFKIKAFSGDKQDKELLHMSDWLNNLISSQPADLRGKIKKPQTSLDEIVQIDEASSTIQASIQYLQGNEVFVHRKSN